MAQDPYQELGVARTASADDIRKAFRKLAKQLHPDKNPDDKAAEERFKRVSAAFDIIGDEDKRKKFDRGQIDADGRETMGGGFDPFSRGGQRSHPGGGGADFGGAQFEGVDLNDILGEMFGGRMGGGPRNARGFGATKGQDVRARLEITLEDAIAGSKKRISFSDGRTIDVSIPKGATDGQVMRLKGQGAPGRAGPGDALIELTIKPHRLYHREGDNLVMDLPITVPDAVLGAKVQAPTPEGPVMLTVAKGSNAGTTLRLKGRGVTNPKTGKRGDLLARLVIVLPESVDSELERFAESWRAQRPYSPKRSG